VSVFTNTPYSVTQKNLPGQHHLRRLANTIKRTGFHTFKPACTCGL